MGVLSNLHTNVFPYLGDLFGKLACIADMQWYDGLRYVLGLGNTNGIIYTYYNFYTSVRTDLNWSGRITGVIFEPLGVLLDLIAPIFNSLFTYDIPFWVAFLVLACTTMIVIYLFKFIKGVLF